MTDPDLNRPKTLLELAGVPGWTTPAAGEAAVILIDAQKEYVSGALPLEGIDDALGEVSRLRDRADELGLPVIHVRHVGRSGGLFDIEAEGGKFCGAAEPGDGEIIVGKALPNAFAGTDLQDRLTGLGVRKLIVAGFMTHMCVSSMVRAALDLGYSSAVVAKACASRALPVPGGGVLSGTDVHRAALTELADRFALVLEDARAV
ncbi:cysteine hydrolase family protein [Roseibium aggregatum]|uniref:Cysteine hydrolase n=1 Tax=Roseibium aggregatum TaxID=187304 RepID=A0A926S8B8_9HYPH|nr:cysteine hydrolase family protein [Roseibium aggregatum]MBD1544734.1 cysteine hydrolase [Roseibium aggregatum]